MGFKDDLDREKHSLMSSKRPYETAAFIIFALMFLRQMFYLLRGFYKFIADGTFDTRNITVVGNLQAFFNRTIFVDSTKWIWVLLAITLLAVYYFLIYIFVWRYCKKRNLAKWTWTTLVIYGPTLFLMPAYIFYLIYIFREYLFRFIKTVIEEYKSFDPKELDLKESELLKEEDKETLERSNNKKEREFEKSEEKRLRQKKKEVKKEVEKLKKDEEEFNEKLED